MVLADLGRKITTALQSLSKATIINEEVFIKQMLCKVKMHIIKFLGPQWNAQRYMHCPYRG